MPKDYFDAGAKIDHAARRVLNGHESDAHSGYQPDGVMWEAPQSLEAQALQKRAYPLDHLPSILRAAIGEVHEYVQAPVGLIATSALMAASLAVQGITNVRRDNTLVGPCSLFGLVVADSGERKTTVDNIFMRPIVEYENDCTNAAMPAQYDHDVALKVWESEVEALRKKLDNHNRQKTVDREAVKQCVAQIQAQEHAKPATPRVERLRYTDATPEALAYGLAHNWPSAGLVSAEAGSVFGGHAMSKDTVMRTLSLLNTIWDGGTVRVDRRTGPSYTLRDVRLTISLQVQAGVLQSALEENGALMRDSGFLSRFLIAVPHSTVGTRLYRAPPEDMPAVTAMQRRIRALLEASPPLRADGTLDLAALRMTADAFEFWKYAFNEFETGIGAGGELETVRPNGAKGAENIARVAAVLHVFETATVQGGGRDVAMSAISLDAVRAAAAVVAWHVGEAMHFTASVDVPIELRNAAKLDAWLIERCLKDRVASIARRAVQQSGPRPVRKPKSLDSALTILEEYGRVRYGEDKIIRVNPALIEARP